MGAENKTCSYLVDNQKMCNKKKWVADLCPLTCGKCNATEAIEVEIEEKEDEAEDDYVGIIQDDMFVSVNQPLPAKVNMFGAKAVTTYKNCDDLGVDLTNAASMIVNEAISSNARWYDRTKNFMTRNAPPVAAEMGEDSRVSSAAGEDSFETNVQVEGIDEADIIKSTNTTVYAAYGDKLIVWEVKTLKILSTTIMSSEKEERRKLSSIPVYFPHNRQVRIKGLLLYKDRLAVIASYYRWYFPFWRSGPTADRPIFSKDEMTSIRLYDVSKIPRDGISELQLVSEKRVPGNFKEARLIGSSAHVITVSNINTHHHLTRDLNPYSRHDLYANMSKSEYITAAATHAEETLIPTFVEKFVNETQCETIHHVTLFQCLDGEQPQKIYKKPYSSIINGFLQVHTFDMNWIGKELDSSGTSFLLPNTYFTNIYASADKLVLATRGQEINSNGTSSTEATFLQMMSLGSPRQMKSYYGVVTGSLLNQYSMDIWKGHLRIATTKSAIWGCAPDSLTPETTLDNTDLVTFRRPCNWTMIVDSDNFIHVLRPSSNENNLKMDQVGYLNNLGKTGEQIYSARFMKDKAFVVTFLRTDPFYSIDLSNPENPKEVGALEIPGFSNYLHPYDREGNLIIGVGQGANDDGVTTGLQISLFDATDFSNATVIQQYSIAEEIGFNTSFIWSSSEAQYEPKAFRFLPRSKKLILPTSIRDYRNYTNSFDGFLVFDLSSERISYSFKISHVNPNNLRSFCWYHAYLPSRSLVHKGVLTTIKGHTVFTHDLDTKEEKLSLNLDVNNSVCNKGGWWLY